MLNGPVGNKTARRERVERLAVRVPAESDGQAGLPEPLVTEEELSMLLGPLPGGAA